MTQILDLMIIADYDLQISEVMNELSYRMSIEKVWCTLNGSINKLLLMEHQCDWERDKHRNLAYTSLYEAWWRIRNMREQIEPIKKARMAIDMESVVGGGN